MKTSIVSLFILVTASGVWAIDTQQSQQYQPQQSQQYQPQQPSQYQPQQSQQYQPQQSQQYQPQQSQQYQPQRSQQYQPESPPQYQPQSVAQQSNSIYDVRPAPTYGLPGYNSYQPQLYMPGLYQNQPYYPVQNVAPTVQQKEISATDSTEKPAITYVNVNRQAGSEVKGLTTAIERLNVLLERVSRPAAEEPENGGEPEENVTEAGKIDDKIEG